MSQAWHSSVVETYKRFPAWVAFLVAFTVAALLAVAAGIAAGITGMFVYDGGNSKGDDFAVMLIGFHSVGTFVFVVSFSWFRRFGGAISLRTPTIALYSCLALALITTLASLNGAGGDYLGFMAFGWLIIIGFGAAGILVSRRYCAPAKEYF